MVQIGTVHSNSFPHKSSKKSNSVTHVQSIIHLEGTTYHK